MDKKLTAILIHTEDYKEHDKRVVLFSAEEGMVMATMRGVKKANAKLKFACQPFALCMYELNDKNGNYSVTGATSIEDMFSLVKNTDKYICASAVVETVKVCANAVASNELFVVMLKTLKVFLYTKTDPYLALAKYVQKVLSMTGFVRRDPPFSGHVTTPAQLLGMLTTRYLDELEHLIFDEKIVKGAVISELKKIEKVFETKINTLRFIE